MSLVGTTKEKLVVDVKKGFYAIGGQIYHEGLKGIKKDLKKEAKGKVKISQKERKKLIGVQFKIGKRKIVQVELTKKK
jgi:hypothetical protein